MGPKHKWVSIRPEPEPQRKRILLSQPGEPGNLIPGVGAGKRVVLRGRPSRGKQSIGIDASMAAEENSSDVH